MNAKLKQYLIDNHELAKDATDEQAKELASNLIASKALSLDKYTELLQAETAQTGNAQQKLADMLAENAKSTTTAIASQLTPVLQQVADALKSRGTVETKAEETAAEEVKAAAEIDSEKMLAEMEAKLIEKLSKQFQSQPFIGNDGASLMKMGRAISADDEVMVRVKSVVERYRHTPTALTYKSAQAKTMGIDGHPQMYGDKEVNTPTERSKMLGACWLKLQVCPETLTESEMEHVQWILHNEKFTVDGTKTPETRLLTEKERHSVLEGHMRLYQMGGYKATNILNETGASGGAYAVPEFFDMDFIVTPTLAFEDLPSYVNVVPVSRGAAAQNFSLGRPTMAAHTEGTGVTEFTTTSIIANHDTTFFRAMGALQVGLNFEEDAHPGLVDGLIDQYRQSARLWFNEQIVAGDGSTEPTGIITSNGTVDITPANPTTGAITLTDVMNSLFGIGKAHRTMGGMQDYQKSLIFICHDQTYKRIRSIATGVTGDTRQVFGMGVHDYRLFDLPVVTVESGITAAHFIAVQAKGYRLYLRQGLRFFREEAGATLKKANTFLLGCDLRAGGQLDLGAYASVIDAFPTS